MHVQTVDFQVQLHLHRIVLKFSEIRVQLPLTNRRKIQAFRSLTKRLGLNHAQSQLSLHQRQVFRFRVEERPLRLDPEHPFGSVSRPRRILDRLVRAACLLNEVVQLRSAPVNSQDVEDLEVHLNIHVRLPLLKFYAELGLKQVQLADRFVVLEGN